MRARSFLRPMAALSVALTLAACAGAGSPTSQTGGGTGGATSPDNPAAAASTGGSSTGGTSGGGGANGFEGKLTSSGIYAATWTVAADLPADVLNSPNHITLTSDKNTFGNLLVKPDGSVSFGSAATELGKNNAFDGSGAHVTLDSTGQFVCAFTVDTDLKGSADGSVLHLAGGLTVHWHPEGLGGLNCP